MSPDSIELIHVAGAGNFGREVMSQARSLAPGAIFLDDTNPIYPSIRAYRHMAGDAVIVAIADPHGREAVTRHLVRHGYAIIIGLRHPTLSLSYDGAEGVDQSAIRMPFSLLSTNVRAGRGLIMNTHSSIGHDCVLGEFCTMASHVAIAGNVRIGNRVEIGTGAVICPGVSIGDDAFIGAGSIVMRDVDPGMRVAGNPARVTGRYLEDSRQSPV